MSKERERFDLEYINVYELVPYDKNPRKNAGAIEAVAQSISEYGFNQPIFIDQNNRIAAGHTRWEAAKLLNMVTVPCVRRDMTEAEFIAYNLADNKTGELAKWDKELVAECLHILDDIASIDVPGFTDKEIDDLFGVSHITESSTPQSGDFGEGKKVTEAQDDEARVKTLKFNFSSKEHRIVDSKLKAIQKEHNLDSLAEALIKALEPYKGLPKTVKKKGPVKVSKES